MFHAQKHFFVICFCYSFKLLFVLIFGKVFHEGDDSALNDWKDLVPMLPEAKWNVSSNNQYHIHSHFIFSIVNLFRLIKQVTMQHLRYERWNEAFQALQPLSQESFENSTDYVKE